MLIMINNGINWQTIGKNPPSCKGFKVKQRFLMNVTKVTDCGIGHEDGLDDHLGSL